MSEVFVCLFFSQVVKYMLQTNKVTLHRCMYLNIMYKKQQKINAILIFLIFVLFLTTEQ